MIRKLFAEFLGSMILVVAAISPVILAVEVLGASIALAVLIDALAVAFILAVLIETLGPVSSAHFNPAVTFAMMISGNMRTAAGLAYMAAQLTGGFADTIAAHAMYFERDFFMLIAVSDIPRTGGAYVGEFIGSFMLLLVIFALMSRNTRFAWNYHRPAGRRFPDHRFQYHVRQPAGHIRPDLHLVCRRSEAGGCSGFYRRAVRGSGPCDGGFAFSLRVRGRDESPGVITSDPLYSLRACISPRVYG
jgi:glycerol uptake facilitator-like aquaporin